MNNKSKRCSNCQLGRPDRYCDIHEKIKEIIRKSNIIIVIDNETMEEYIDIFGIICNAWRERFND